LDEEEKENAKPENKNIEAIRRKLEKLRKQALEKLTPEEKTALGV